MKKSLRLSLALLACIFLLISFSLKKKHNHPVTSPNAAVNCVVPAAAIISITDAGFKAR